LEEKSSEGDVVSHTQLLQEWFPPIKSWQVPQRLHVVPVAQVHALELQFPMPSILHQYESKPTRYLSHLIGHEGKGSLLSLLKAKHYAQELYADDASKSCLPWSIFTIRMELTETGLENVHDVIRIVFCYIELLRTSGPKDWIQDELQTVGDLQFRFLSQRNPMDYTCSLAGWMQLYPPERYLSGPYKLYSWKPEAVVGCLRELNPDNMLMIISSPTMAGTTTQEEPWYGTQYESIPVDETLWDTWRNTQHWELDDLQLPQINDMIATQFNILPCPDDIPKDEPRCIMQSEPIQLWYKPDNVFAMPKVNMLFQFASGDHAPEAIVATHLFAEIVQDHVNEFTYLASMANLHCDIGLSQTGLELHVTGYDHKAHVLVERVVNTMTGIEEIDPDVYDRITYKLEQEYQSFLVAQPYQHAIYGADLCLENNSCTISEKLTALRNITSDEVLQFSKRFWKHCQLEGLVHGNVTPQHAKEITETIWSKLRRKDDSHTSLERRVVQLASGASYLYRFAGFNPANTNSVLQIVLQMGVLELPDNATLAFLHHLIREPAFNQLRTEEQLGYIVHTSIKTSGDNIKGMLFLIQSDSFDPIHVESRVEEFLASFRQRIVSMTVEDFQENVDAVVASFLEKNKNLGEESSRYWHVILNKTYNFRRLQQIAEHVKEISKRRVLRFFDKYVAASAPHRRKLCVQVFAKQHEELMKEEVDSDTIVIEDPSSFKSSMPLYPLPKRVKIEVVDIKDQ